MGMQFMVIACASGMSHFKENVSFGAKIALVVRWGNVYICTEMVPKTGLSPPVTLCY